MERKMKSVKVMMAERINVHDEKLLRKRKTSDESIPELKEEETEIGTSKETDDADSYAKDADVASLPLNKEELQSEKLQVLKERMQLWESGYEKRDKRKEQIYTRVFSLLAINAAVVVGIATIQSHLTWLDCIVPTTLVAIAGMGFSVILNLDKKLVLILRTLEKKKTDKKKMAREWEELQSLGAQDSEMEEWCKDEEEDEIPSSANRWRFASLIAFSIFLWAVFVAGRCWLDYCKTVRPKHQRNVGTGITYGDGSVAYGTGITP